MRSSSRWFRALLPCCALAFALIFAVAGANGRAAGSDRSYFVVRVLDEQTGRGVPLMELETVNGVRHVTDSAGVIAFNEPGLMEQEVFFHVRGHGYEYPKDGFGYRGLKLVPRAGESAAVRVRRVNVAERLYRLTGEGIYRDSVLAGLPVPLRNPVLNAQVLGQDTVIVASYRGKLFWFWGDTDQAGYPLGNFAASGATSELPGQGGLAPGVGVDLAYSTGPKGFAQKMCPDFGKGLHWIESAFAVPDEHGRERLVARVSSQEGFTMPYAWHIAVWNDEKAAFESKVRWPGADGHDAAHAFRARVDGVDYVYLFPNYRVRADLASALQPERYEAFTCIAGDGKFRGAATTIERDARGAPRYAWKAGADRLEGGRVKQLVAAGQLRAEESWLRVRDIATGAAFEAGRGSVFWNEFRQRWIMLAAAAPGEVWFGEAEWPTGPWGYVRRVVAHDDYNFYNVTQHPYFDEEGGRLVYFEGTYTASFSAAKAKTPRYDYNQIMYRLALDDARLRLPRPVYRVAEAGVARLALRSAKPAGRETESGGEIAFHALPPEPGPIGDGLVAVRQDARGRLTMTMSAEPAADRGEVLFLALPAEAPAESAPPEIRSAAVVPLYVYRRAVGDGVRYSTDPAWTEKGFERDVEPVCRVWSAAR